MSISKGAFGQSAKGGFIESPMGARGWNAGGIAVLSSDGGTTNRYLAALDAADGAKLWEVAPIAAAGTGASQLVFNSAFKLFMRRGANAGVESRSMVDGATIATRALNSMRVPAAIGTDLVLANSDPTLGNVQRRIPPSLAATDVWLYDAPNTNQIANCHTDSSGNSYFVTTETLVNTLFQGIHRWALDSNGVLLWEQFQEATTFDAYGHTPIGIVDTDDTYIYSLMVDSSGGTSEIWCYRFLKSDGSRVDDRTTAFDTGEGGTVSTIVNNARVANNSVYLPISANTFTYSVVRMAKDMTLMSGIDLGVKATSVDVLPNDSIGTGDVLVVGLTSTTWPGSGGERANCWRISADLSTIRWGVQIGTATYGGLHGICSYKPRYT